MQARVKPGYRWPTLLAFGGHEFSKRDWSTVPPDFEDEALKHEDLEIFGAGVSTETPKKPENSEKPAKQDKPSRPAKSKNKASAESDTPAAPEDPGDEEPKPEESDKPDASEGGA
jgi:hypothetical protein